MQPKSGLSLQAWGLMIRKVTSFSMTDKPTFAPAMRLNEGSRTA